MNLLDKKPSPEDQITSRLFYFRLARDKWKDILPHQQDAYTQDDDNDLVLHPLQHYLSHIKTMEWMIINERLCAMNHCTVIRWIRPPVGFKPRTLWSEVRSANHSATLRLLPHYILEESNFNFRYVRLWDLDIPWEKRLNYLQTVETLIRRHNLWRLIWVCTVCQLPFYGSPDYNGSILKPLYKMGHYKMVFGYKDPKSVVSKQNV